MIEQMCVFMCWLDVPQYGVGKGQFKSSTTHSGESVEVNVSDHNYEVGHKKQKRPETNPKQKG